MKITFIGATHEVTGSCYYLEAAGHKFLVDCGMEQGPDYYENAEIPVALGEIEFVLLTHAHMDHSGNLPATFCKRVQGSCICNRGNQSSVRYYVKRQCPHSDV